MVSMTSKVQNVKVLNNHFNNKYRKLRAAQKRLSRRQKGSKNREKARIAVAKIQAQIADSRKDFLHKLTTQLIRENQVIAVEDLAVRNMVKNRSLARSISNAGWGELVRQLE
jgi:putative transposase